MNDANQDAGEFDLAGWTESLKALNPWAGGMDSGTDEYVRERRKSCFVRSSKGRGEWNRWAEAMRERKAEFEEAFGEEIEELALTEKPGSIEAQAWVAAATADFSGSGIDAHSDFSSFIFPGDANFRGAQARGPSSLKDARFLGTAIFEEFKGDVVFDGAQFRGRLYFDRAEFIGGAKFETAQFFGKTEFRKAMFPGETNFNNAKFFELTTFADAKFFAFADFNDAQFSKSADFSHVQFSLDSSFNRAQFSDVALFINAQFDGGYEFR